mmetsp:Transcript_63683/g.125416  ORF Transcript_63683/g.125416 Transcript_63683/m.125416 type:complete len:220 (-) Transcript_63683:113-772(-)
MSQFLTHLFELKGYGPGRLFADGPIIVTFGNVDLPLGAQHRGRTCAAHTGRALRPRLYRGQLNDAAGGHGGGARTQGARFRGGLLDQGEPVPVLLRFLISACLVAAWSRAGAFWPLRLPRRVLLFHRGGADGNAPLHDDCEDAIDRLNSFGDHPPERAAAASFDQVMYGEIRHARSEGFGGDNDGAGRKRDLHHVRCPWGSTDMSNLLLHQVLERFGHA